MAEYREGFRFSSGAVEYSVIARTLERPAGNEGATMLAFDVLSKPGEYGQNRIFDIGGGLKGREDARRLTMRLLEDTYGFAG